MVLDELKEPLKRIDDIYENLFNIRFEYNLDNDVLMELNCVMDDVESLKSSLEKWIKKHYYLEHISY